MTASVPPSRKTAGAENYRGKLLLVGITVYDHTGEILDRYQYHGVIEAVSDRIYVRLADGSIRTLPPDTEQLIKAKPGLYRERSTGETVENPDYLTSWSVHKAPPEEQK